MIELPIDEKLPEIVDGLRADGRLVLEAPPGAGKTTRVPPALMHAFSGSIVVLEPRRIAAVSSAQRVAQELGESVGQRVGYRVRFDSNISSATRIEYLTYGVFLRRIATDPQCSGIGCVVFDEFHERQLDSDLCLALCMKAAEQGYAPRLLLMSATLDAAPLAQHLKAKRIRAPGRTFPVEVVYATARGDRALHQRVAGALHNTSGDTLVFLPGVREIERCAESIATRDFDVRRLHGQQSAKEQSRVFGRSEGRRVILATNVAETSVTVEGVTCVIDSGLARLPDWDPATGLSALSVVPISQASAIQRAGRAGRTEPGFCLRLYSRSDFEHRPEYTPAEMVRADLAGLVLTVLGLGFETGELNWVTPPPPAAVDRAMSLLHRLGILDGDGLTDFGARVHAIPLHPRLGALLDWAAQTGNVREASVLTALLSEYPGAGRGRANSIESSDLEWQAQEFQKAETGNLRHAERIRKVARRLERGVSSRAGTSAAFSLRRLVFRAFSDRLAKRVRTQGSQVEVLFASGGRATLHESSVVRDAEWLVAVESIHRGNRGHGTHLITRASAVDLDWVLADLDHEIHAVEDLKVVDERVVVEEGFKMGELWLERTARTADPGPAATQMLFSHLKKRGLRGVFSQAQLEQAFGRLELVGVTCSEESLLLAACEGHLSVDLVRRQSLESLLYGVAAEVDFSRLAPTSLGLPSGRTLPVRYAPGRAPWIESYLQDFYGMVETPRVSGQPLVVHLWAPNGRAVQVTQDLESFWRETYPTLRRSLSRRYPKHVWSEDPLKAEPHRLKRHRRSS